MSDSLTNLNGYLIEFYRQHALDVFRYHLVRSGDWQEAEALTAETFRRTQAWFTSHQAANGEAKIWLFRIAVAMYSRFRRPPGFYRGDDMLASPTQEQLTSFASAAELHEEWHRLPRKEQDARALSLFAGLELTDVAAVTGLKLQDTVDRLERLTADQVELRQLAGQLQPVGYFIGRLEKELRESADAPSVKRAGPARVKWMWLRYRLGPLLTLISQALPLLFLGSFLVWVVKDTTSQTAPAIVNTQQPTNSPQRRTSEPTGRTAFIPSEDSAILVSAQGGIFVYHLADGRFARMIRVSEDGFLGPRGTNPNFPPQVSPDGTWLSIVSLKDGSTWLFSLNGTQRRQISASSLSLTWAPGGGEAVYPLPDDPRALYQYSAAAIYNHELARFPGVIQAVAWSPDGRWIGVVYQTEGSSADFVRTTLSMIPSRGGKHVDLSSREDPIQTDILRPGYMRSSDSTRTLLWTDDSSELWYPAWNAAVDVDQALASELAKAQTSQQVDQMNVALKPLTIQPRNNWYGYLYQLLYGNEVTDTLMNRVVEVTSDRRQIASLLANPNGVVGSVAVQDSENLDSNRWIRSFGRLGKISWTTEGGSLLASEYADQPGQILRINARNGRSIVIAEDHWLLGTISELRYKAGKHAPQAMKIPLSGPDISEPKVRVDHPGLGVSLEVPVHFRVFQMAGADPYGVLFITNFDLADPLGFISLNPDDLLVTAYRMGPPGTNIQSILTDMAPAEPDRYEIQPFSIGDRQAYRMIIYRQSGPTVMHVFITDPKGPIMLYYQPEDTSKRALFIRMVASLQVAQPPGSTPTPEPSEAPTPTAEIAWNRYTSPNLGVTFEVPAPYMNDPVCGARESDKQVQVGSEVYVTTDRLGGRALADYVDQRLTQSDTILHISSRESTLLPGGEAITLEGSLDVTGFFSQTYIRSGDRVWLIGLAPNQSCGETISVVSDLQVYRRMVASLRVLQ